MGRSQETFNKKEVRQKKEKKRKDKAQKRLDKKEAEKKSLDDMIAYVDENGVISSTPPDPTKKKEEIKAEDIELGVPTRDAEDYDPVRKGVVYHYNDSKGFGFIKDSVTKESIFFHVNNATEEIKEGNQVSFEIEMGPKGPAAVKVSKVI
ncbi:cold-shock protein [Bacteroidota bacterium]